MTKPVAGDTPEDLRSKILSCATALRLGGALYILHDAADMGDLYYMADAGVRAGMRSCTGRPVNSDVMRVAIKASKRLETEYSGPDPTLPFVRLGLETLTAVLAVINGGSTPNSHEAIFEKSIQAADSWPTAVNVESFTSLAEFERSCQEESIENLRNNGIAGVANLAGSRELQYRDAAKGSLKR